MGTASWLALALSIAASAGAAGPGQGPSEPPAGARAQVALSGHVSDEGGQPIGGVEVRIQSATLDVPFSVFTDASGRFTASLPASRISVSASHPDFGLQFTGDPAVSGS
jgi:hypothetical protein